MPSLGEQLLARGLVKERVVREAEGRRDIDALEAERRYRAHVGVEDLDAAADRKEFRELARRVLLQNPGAIGTVIEKAHRFKDDADSHWPRYIAFFYRLRTALEGCRTDSRRVQLIREEFRDH